MGPAFFTQPLDLVVLALFAFLVLGPKRFPELARSAGRWLREMRAEFSSLASPQSPDEQADSDAGMSSVALAADPESDLSPRRSRYRDLDAIG
jgi:Sec-independent protein translocase protein TatA